MKRCWTGTRITYARIISEGVPSAAASPPLPPPPPPRLILWQFVPPVQFVNFLRLLLVYLLFMTRLFPILESARPTKSLTHSVGSSSSSQKEMPTEEHKIIIIIIYALPPIPGNLSMQRIVLHWHHVVVEKFNLKASFSFRPPNAICLTAEPTIRLPPDTRKIRRMKRSPPFTTDQFTRCRATQIEESSPCPRNVESLNLGAERGG